MKWKAISLATLFGLTGCTSTKYYEQPRISQKRQSIELESLFSEEDIIIETNLKNSSIDDLIKASNDAISYLKFRKKYSASYENIIEALNKREFSKVNNIVKKLSIQLSKDHNPYSKKYLNKIKNFRYKK